MSKRVVDAFDIPVKSYFNADLFVAFAAVCKELRITHSRALVNLATKLVEEHRKPEPSHKDMPSSVLLWAQVPACGRVNFGSAPVHLRL